MLRRMVNPLAERHCEVCRPGTPTLPEDAVTQHLKETPTWTVADQKGHQVLTKTFKFRGFMPGVELVNKIAAIAEEEGHHPDLHLSYGSLEVDLTTHAAGGLTDNDFILAAKIDQLAPPALRATSP
jgi:4a-hydroxytetrahydrobiopterin dehydratase